MHVTKFDRYERLEPTSPFEDLDEGLAARVADPAWFLARQWQLGEHQGEDASSPVAVIHRSRRDLIDPVGGDPRWDPALVPPEAVVESEPGDWWTPARRLSIGLRAVASGLTPPAVLDPNDPGQQLLRECLVQGLPMPFADRFAGRAYDGLRLHIHQTELGIAASVFEEAPADPLDFWEPSELAYRAGLTCSGVQLQVDRHDGGRLDWYSVDAAAPLPTRATPPKAVTVFPGRMSYPGAPHPRWWQIEDAAVDIGGAPPDISHFPTMLLVDLMVSHGDNWFTFPIDGPVGAIVSLEEVLIRDSFDDTWPVIAPDDWSMFRVRGLSPRSVLLWPTADQALTGAPLERVTFGIDEDANLLWAVEQRLDGREVDPAPPVRQLAAPGDVPDLVDADRPPSFVYRPSIGAARHWHPYQIRAESGRRLFRQARLGDPDAVGGLMPEPRAAVLDPPGGIHEIEPATIPVAGIEIQRRWRLARQTDGRPVLWIQRERVEMAAPPISGLRFDVLARAADGGN